MGQETQTEQKKRIHPPRREKTGAEAPPLWLDLLHALVWSVVLVALCFTFFVRIICVEGISMEPALRQNDRVLVLSTLWHAPQNGDIVVFRKDSFLSEAVIKRIIATEGQTVDIDFDAGVVYVDGQALDEPYTFEPTYLSYAEYGKALDYPVTVPEGELFVMGDNRNHSEDSRFSDVGCVKKEAVLGKVLLVVFPGRQTNEFGAVTGGRSWHRFGAVS